MPKTNRNICNEKRLPLIKALDEVLKERMAQQVKAKESCSLHHAGHQNIGFMVVGIRAIREGLEEGMTVDEALDRGQEAARQAVLKFNRTLLPGHRRYKRWEHHCAKPLWVLLYALAGMETGYKQYDTVRHKYCVAD